MDSALLEISYTIVTFLFLSFFTHRSLHLTKRHYLNWFLFGFFVNIYSLSWLYTTYPLPWLTPGIFQIAGITLLLIVLACGAGASYAVVGSAFTKNLAGWRQVLVFTTLVALAEILRSFMFSLLFAGEGSSVGLHWTSGTLGNALSSTPLIEYAYFGGTYMLSALVGLIVFVALTHKKLKYWPASYAALIVGWFFIHYTVPIHMPEQPLRVGVITTDFSKTISTQNLKEEFFSRFSKLNDMTQGFAQNHIDIIAYPEDARYTDQLDEKHLEEISKSFPETLFIDGEKRELSGNLSNFSLFYSPENKHNVSGRGKVFLFPFSEYLPIIFRKGFSFFTTQEKLGEYETEHTYARRTSMQTFPWKGTRVGTIICSEIVSFQTIRSLAKEKPSLVIFQSYLSIFNGKMWFALQDRSFTKIAAAQLRVPLITSANGAESYVVSPYGSIIATIPKGFSTSLVLVGTTTVSVAH